MQIAPVPDACRYRLVTILRITYNLVKIASTSNERSCVHQGA
jgi:hypothetical protein